LGVVYSSGAVLADTMDERPQVIEPTMPACVGSRAPHVWLDCDGERLSTLDLFGSGFILLTGADGAAWRDAARVVKTTLGVPLGAVTIGGAELHVESDDWRSAYGIDRDGAVLVRPDGHIAWRSPSAAADAASTLQQVVTRVLGLGAKQRTGLVGSVIDAEDRRCA
jgi:hypothetical protein